MLLKGLTIPALLDASSAQPGTIRTPAPQDAEAATIIYLPQEPPPHIMLLAIHLVPTGTHPTTKSDSTSTPETLTATLVTPSAAAVRIITGAFAIPASAEII